MILRYTPMLFNNIRSMTINVDSIGTTSLSIEDEQLILDDYSPIVEYKDMDFKGYFNIDGGKNVIQVYPKQKYTLTFNLTIPTNYADNGDGTVSITIGSKIIVVTATTSEIDKINTAVLNEIKANEKVLTLFTVDDINLENGVVSAIKDSYIVNSTTDINAVNNIYGNVVNQTSVIEGSGDLITLNIINKKLKIDKDFEAKFTIPTKDVRDSELGKILNTKDLIAEGKCILFKNVVSEYVRKTIENIKAKENDFEKVDPNISEEF